MRAVTDLEAAKKTLLAELREHSLILGEVTLSSGATAQYYVDARRALMRPGGFLAAGELIAAVAGEVGAAAVGGPATAAIPPSCAAIAVPSGAGLVAFFVRGERKEHGLQRWVEGPVEPGMRCLVVEDTVTTGGSTAKAIGRIREEVSRKPRVDQSIEVSQIDWESPDMLDSLADSLQKFMEEDESA